MNSKEKEEDTTQRVKKMLDDSQIEITTIWSSFREKKLLRDLETRKDVIITSFTDAIFNRRKMVFTDAESLEMLYVQTGPYSFVEIETYFNLDSSGDG